MKVSWQEEIRTITDRISILSRFRSTHKLLLCTHIVFCQDAIWQYFAQQQQEPDAKKAGDAKAPASCPDESKRHINNTRVAARLRAGRELAVSEARWSRR